VKTSRSALRRLVLLVSGLCVGVALYLGFDNIVVRPFPFLDVTYAQRISKFNAAPDDFPIKLEIPLALVAPDAVADETIQSAIGKPLLTKVTIATDYARRLQEVSTGARIRGINDAFSRDSAFASVCSESSKVFVAIMQLMGISARVVWMDGHTVSEVWNVDHWMMVDTYGNLMARDQNGRFLSVVEITANYDESQFTRVSAVTGKLIPDYLPDGYLNSQENVYRRQSLYFVVDGEHLFSFHDSTRSVAKVLLSVVDVDPERIGYGVQFVGDDFRKVGNVGINLIRRILPAG
jgi:hypothetical protein